MAAAEHPLSPRSLLYVLYVLYGIEAPSAGCLFAMLDYGFRFFFQWLAQQARVWLSTGLPKGIRFSMVRPTGLRVRPTRLEGFRFSMVRGGVSFFNGSPNGSAGVSFFNGSPNAPGEVSFFNGSQILTCGGTPTR